LGKKQQNTQVFQACIIFEIIIQAERDGFISYWYSISF